jgi:hypothetical protein
LYIYERNRSAALAVAKRIEDLAAVRYPFLIFYAIDNAADEVVILHVRHAAQDRP